MNKRAIRVIAIALMVFSVIEYLYPVAVQYYGLTGYQYPLRDYAMPTGISGLILLTITYVLEKAI